MRQEFVRFFEKKNHLYVPSSSLKPTDPNLLFVNSGMNQFRDVFLGTDSPPSSRVVNFQRCLRGGGKHNDLDQVGVTKRHHTFFEMLGNWSFGDYWKTESIEWSWEFLLHVGIDPKRLWITVHESDMESLRIWEDMGIIQIVVLGDKDNFWEMGDIGPCGPCSEIIYDMGTPCGDKCKIGVCDCDRWLEIWNLVFMQYNRHPDRTLSDLPMKCVDTGMGLERLCVVLQGVDSNYETDLFTPIMEKSGQQIVSDHMRGLCFSIRDGIFPSNKGGRYVLRKMLRRCLWLDPDFDFLSLIRVIGDVMKGPYPEWPENQIRSVLKKEIDLFHTMLERGQKVIKRVKTEVVTSDVIHDLLSTHGITPDMSVPMLEERGHVVDMTDWEEVVRKHSKKSGK